MDRRIIIVTYYWPPLGGGGVQRWLKFVKYLALEGWEPIVVTPENPSFSLKDETLLRDVPPGVDVLRIPIWEPHDALSSINRMMGKKEIKQGDYVRGGKSFLLRIATWVRGHLFFPDARRFWVKPVVQLLSSIIAEQGITRIVTTGPPHSMHLIGLRLKRRFPHLFWLADFRDPWSEWDVTNLLVTADWAMRIHRRMERRVLARADKVINVSPYYAERLSRLGNRSVDVIANGFDEDDFKSVAMPAPKSGAKFTILQVGVIETRDPRPFFQALAQVCASHQDIADDVEVHFIGHVPEVLVRETQQDSRIGPLIHFTDQRPHDEVLRRYQTADLLLLFLAPTNASGHIPGKTYEYMAARKPILGIGDPNGAAAADIARAAAGVMVGYEDVAGMADKIVFFYRQWKAGELWQFGDISAYSRKALTLKLISLLPT